MQPIMLASLSDTKSWLNITHSSDDIKVTGLIYAASAMVLEYLKMDPEDFSGSEYDSDGEYPSDSDGVLDGTLPQMSTATMYLAGMLYRDPDGAESDKWERGYLPRPVTAMLYSLRDPALA